MANSNLGVLIAASIYPPDVGGPATHARVQYEGFSKRGIRTGLVALAHYRKWPIGLRHIIFLFKLMILASKYNVIYAHDAVGTGLPALITSKIFTKGLVIRSGGDLAWEREAEKNRTNLSMNGWYEQGKNRSNWLFLISKFVLHHADSIVVPSVLLSELYISAYGVSKNKIKVITNPLNSDNYPDVSGDLAKTMVFASRLVSYKNLPTAIRAFAEVAKSHSDFKFIIMGDGPEKENLRALASDLGVIDRVIFTGNISQAEVIKNTARCLFAIAPALTEFNPNYILQSVALGKPFIISRENGLPYVLPESLVFSALDTNDLAKKIENLLDTDGYARAQKEVLSLRIKWSWDDVLELNLMVIRSVSR